MTRADWTPRDAQTYGLPMGGSRGWGGGRRVEAGVGGGCMVGGDKEGCVLGGCGWVRGEAQEPGVGFRGGNAIPISGASLGATALGALLRGGCCHALGWESRFCILQRRFGLPINLATIHALPRQATASSKQTPGQLRLSVSSAYPTCCSFLSSQQEYSPQNSPVVTALFMGAYTGMAALRQSLVRLHASWAAEPCWAEDGALVVSRIKHGGASNATSDKLSLSHFLRPLWAATYQCIHLIAHN